MRPSLLKIPGVNEEAHTHEIEIRALAFDGKSEALMGINAMSEADYKKIIKAMNIRAATPRNKPINNNLVRKCSNSKHGDVYEFKAKNGDARVMFFYLDSKLIICTNVHSKEQDADQDASFKRCAAIKAVCLKCDAKFLTV